MPARPRSWHASARDHGDALAARRGGLYWVAPGVILLLVVAVANAWVLLIEIDRVV